MVGSLALATEISTFPFAGREIEEASWLTGRPTTYIILDMSVLPEGWTLLGSGCTRFVFLGPDGVAYKVESDALFDYKNVHNEERVSNNFMEAMVFEIAAEAISNNSKGRCRLAELTYFYDINVVAMECSTYVSDVTNLHEVGDWVSDFGLQRDLHGDNVWVDDKGIVLVDYACGRFS